MKDAALNKQTQLSDWQINARRKRVRKSPAGAQRPPNPIQCIQTIRGGREIKWRAREKKGSPVWEWEPGCVRLIEPLVLTIMLLTWRVGAARSVSRSASDLLAASGHPGKHVTRPDRAPTGGCFTPQNIKRKDSGKGLLSYWMRNPWWVTPNSIYYYPTHLIDHPSLLNGLSLTGKSCRV